ncbi:hypothetical protein SLEP1_g21681 [Rubroshorea leprosula]|uniref:Uncharacterized protein n=1 Tax=Rubroshorea leprosula TaxID=152421 RepID=A0AAV5JHF9_9ROSI|nr:hypothetical protein SLEP1_g21681 [Rubroshorea leprosula]
MMQFDYFLPFQLVGFKASPPSFIFFSSFFCSEESTATSLGISNLMTSGSFNSYY